MMFSRRKAGSAVLGLILSLSMLARSARADDPKVRVAPPPLATPTEVEVLVVGGQYLLGAGIAFGSLVAAFGTAPAGLGFALLAPAVVGGVVCWIGGKSRTYDGGCTGPIAGAYLGALTVIPGALLGAWLSDTGEMDMSGGIGLLGGALLSWISSNPWSRRSSGTWAKKSA